MKDIQDYLINFIEKKHSVFNDFPVCPFAKKERLTNNIKYVECCFVNINVQKVVAATNEWLQGDYSTILYIDKGSANFIETNHFHNCVKTLLANNKVNTFIFHKENKRKFGEIYTRQSPRPFIMAGYKNQIGKKKTQLLKTSYYDKRNNKEYKKLNSKEKQDGKNKAGN